MPAATAGQEQKILAELEKLYGKDSMRNGDEVPSIQRISTGSRSLDWACGLGPGGGRGVPKGRWSRFWGPKSSGKTMAAWGVARTVIEAGGTVAYYNIEGVFDKDWVKAMGVDPKKVKVFEGKVIEEVGTKLYKTMPIYDLHILDSCSAAISNLRASTELEQKVRGDRAQAWFDAFEMAAEAFDDSRNTVIYIDQVRVTQGTYQGGLHAPGGNFMEHHSSMTLFFMPTGWLYRDAKGQLIDKSDSAVSGQFSGQKEAQGRQVRVQVEKSRVGKPQRAANLWLDFDHRRFDPSYEFAEMGLALGLIQKSGAHYKIKGAKKAHHGMAQLRSHIAMNRGFQEKVLEAMPA